MRIQNLLLIVLGLMMGTMAIITSSGADSKSTGTVHFQERFETGLSRIWKEVKFTEKTEYQIVKAGTNSVLEARANNSASGLAVDKNIKMIPGLKLEWRWKIDKTPRNGTETDIKSFDHSARLFIAFQSKLGPPRTINYVWANRAKTNESFEHPRSSRARFIVLQNGNDRAQQWITEVRDINADWARLFGDVSPPPIVGIGLMTDSDGTKDKVTGWYDDLVLFQEH
jgi:hypothetical protein